MYAIKASNFDIIYSMCNILKLGFWWDTARWLSLYAEQNDHVGNNESNIRHHHSWWLFIKKDSLCSFNSSTPLNCFLNITAMPAPMRQSSLMQWANASSSGQENRSPLTYFSPQLSSGAWPGGGAIAPCDEARKNRTRNKHSRLGKGKLLWHNQPF